MGNFWPSLASVVESETKRNPARYHMNEDSLCSYYATNGFHFATDEKTNASIHLKLHTALLSFMFFALLFIVVNLLTLLITAYKRLTLDMEILWTQTIVHFIFAGITAPLSLWFIFEGTLKADIVNSTISESVILICITVGFMAYEITSLLAANCLLRYFNQSLLFQDLITLTGSCLLLYYDQAHFFGLIAIAVEGVSVFKSITWMLKHLGLSRTWLGRLFQHTAIHLCHYCPLLGVYCLVLSYEQVDALFEDMPTPILLVLYTGLLTELFLIAPYWSAKLMEELYRFKVIKIPTGSGVYHLCSVSVPNVQQRR